MAYIEYRSTHKLTGVLVLESGLRVGAGRDSVEIGGIDNPIIKHPHTQDPYIPGSSLKGKLRSLLEWALNKIEADGRVWGNSSAFGPGDEVLRIFGTTNKDWTEGPSRAVFRDLMLDPSWRQDVVMRGLQLTEEKAEVAINRIEGKADRMGPRTMERIPAGARFHFEILFREFSVDLGSGPDKGALDRRCLNRLVEALRLLEQDALGGSGSRGYGQVRVERLVLDGSEITSRFREYSRFDLKQPFPFLDEQAPNA